MLGMVAYTYYNVIIGCDPLTSGIVSNTNQIIPHFVSEIVNLPGFLGIYYASIFSGALSSMSTSYNSISCLIWEDWLKPILKDKLSKKQTMIAVKFICKSLTQFQHHKRNF